MKNESLDWREASEEIPVLVWMKNENKQGSFIWWCYRGLGVRAVQQLPGLPGQGFLQLLPLIPSSSRIQAGSPLPQVLTCSFAVPSSLVNLASHNNFCDSIIAHFSSLCTSGLVHQSLHRNIQERGMSLHFLIQPRCQKIPKICLSLNLMDSVSVVMEILG